MAQVQEKTQEAPFAIGGLGGSGTRATAMLVRNCGCWLGGDLNEALDNLWFTLLFKRASVLTDVDARLKALFTLFLARMRGEIPGPEMTDQLAALASQDRLGHSIDWLETRLQSLMTASGERPEGVRWCWKEPNTHIVIEQLFRHAPDLKYVHVVRDPLYMASSTNHNQLNNWGRIFLDREVSAGPRDAIAYWAAIHRRLVALGDLYPDRIMFFSHDAFMANPASEASRLLAFLQLDPPADQGRLFEGIEFRIDGRLDNAETALKADPADLAFCNAFTARFA